MSLLWILMVLTSLAIAAGACFWMMFTAHKKLYVQACAYAGYDRASIIAGRYPTAAQVFDGLRKERHLLDRRARNLMQKLETVAEDSSFLLESIPACADLFDAQIADCPDRSRQRHAMSLVSRGLVFGRIASSPSEMAELVREWSRDSIAWCSVVITLGPGFVEELDAELDESLNDSV